MTILNQKTVMKHPWWKGVVFFSRVLGMVLVVLLGANPTWSQDHPVDEHAVSLSRVFSGEAPRSVKELQSMETLLQQVTKQASKSVVAVEVGPAQGSGVIISKEGYVLTAGHVVGKPGRRALLILPDGRRLRGKTFGVNRHIDAGLIKITEEGDWPHARIGDSSKLRPGHWCLTLGHPGGYEEDRQPVLRLGRILVVKKKYITTDCPLVGGDSGGPLFDLQGRLIGVHSRIGSDLAVNIHVPVNTYRDNWKRLAAGEDWGVTLDSRPFIGVQWDSSSNKARISKVLANSPAEKAGVLKNDTIIEFEGDEVDDFETLQLLVGGKAPGDRVKIVVLRKGRRITLDLVIGTPTGR